MQFVQNGVNGKNRYVVKGNKVYDSVNGQHLYTIDNGVMRSAITGAILTNGPVFVSDGETVDLSFVTATAGDILSGKVGADKDGKPVNGSIETVTPTLAWNKFTVGKGYVAEEKELTVPESLITETSEKVTIGVGYVAEQKEFDIQSGGSSGGWEIYRIKSYIHAESIVQSYIFALSSSLSSFADSLNGIYIRKTKDGYYDRYVNTAKGKVMLAVAYRSGVDQWCENRSGLQNVVIERWLITDLKDSDEYINSDLVDQYTYSETFNLGNASATSRWYYQVSTGGTGSVFASDSNYPISVNEWHPKTIIGNKAIGYSEDSPIVSNEDTELSGFQYTIEVGKSYVTKDKFVIGHPCFMPDKRISLIMSGMDDYDANANGIYTQNDFMESSQNSTWSNPNGYTIKYDYMSSQWGCFAPNGSMVANGGYGDSPIGATWYEMVNWSGTEVTLELYG